MLRLLTFVVLFSGVMAYLVPDLAPQLIAYFRPSGTVAVASAPAGAPGRLTLDADRAGHFRTRAQINGKPFSVLVDTGATVVALRHEDAQDLGLVSAADRYDATVTTAKGPVQAKRVRLGRVQLGSITVRDVEAVVLPAGMLGENLLGMSVLSRLARFEVKAGRLVLEE